MVATVPERGRLGAIFASRICEPNSGYDRARNQGPKWQRSCWKTVYSTGPRGCNLDRQAFRVDATVASSTGAAIKAIAFATSIFNLGGGFITWTNGAGVLERRSITGHTGDTVSLLFGTSGIPAGTPLSAWPSCARTWGACEARNNTANYGGSVYKPGKNPLEGVSMSWS